jgi:thiol-disulfide isomerase/thioredoxin
VSAETGSGAGSGSGAGTRTAARVSRGRLLAWALALVLIAALLWIGLAGRGSSAERPAPALPHVALVGAPVTLASLLGAPTTGAAATAGLHGTHPALVLFWASWCTPCQQEAPAVERFAHGAAGHGRIAAVDYGESETSLPRAFLRRYRWSFPTLSDPDDIAGEAYRVRVLPTTFAIDARGRIVATLSGPQTEQSLARALAAAG